MASKKARPSETERFIELWYEEEILWNILSDKARKRKKCWNNVGKTKNDKG